MEQALRGEGIMPLKVTTWNLKNSDRLIVDNPSDNVEDRLARVKQTIETIDPDILCIQEGPKGEVAIDEFCGKVLDRQWLPVLLRQASDALGDRDKEYQIKGTQWIWFLVRTGMEERCVLQPPTTWQDFLGRSRWPVHFWGVEKEYQHYHWRHPQVMILDVGNGQNIELIGVHLKSKINRRKITWDNGVLTGDFVDEALKARIKLATEARNIRSYIGAKFNQLAEPGIVVLGDCNDGVGHDKFEREYLFFDLISNIQGDVMFAERYFNHALFDCPAHLRWSARFADKVMKVSAANNPLLLDHILMSQPLCRDQLPIVANAHAGMVEHETYMRENAGSNSKTRTSDHRPVTIEFDDTT
jgi:hypothetical protein